MNQSNATILTWELAGIPFIAALGSTLHFAFAWFGQWLPLAVFSAVNESIWEHLKLAFWPGLVWALVERRFLPVRAVRFWAVKGIALLVAPVTIVVVFSTYTAILGTNLLILDIGTFILAIIAGQMASAWLLLTASWSLSLMRTAHLVLAGQVIAYSTFTYFPPRIALFQETTSGAYGIPEAEVSRSN